LKIESWPGEKQASYPLKQYDRYYAGVTVRGRRMVRGKLIVPPNREDHPKTGIHITGAKYLPQLHGGGCANVSVMYSVDANSGSGQCEVSEAEAPPSEEPHWQPDEQTAARMEAAVREYLQETHPEIADFNSYGRYYWGVTIDGSQLIRGRIMLLRASEAGVHLASDWDNGPFIFDGRCQNIEMQYDPKGAKLVQLRCDGEAPKPLH